ncbi:MAG TPA: YbjN domain-containing protein [Actinomycetota bacterium]|nr:YbjN domain-containing protein [Actinomycetota bacterium]
MRPDEDPQDAPLDAGAPRPSETTGEPPKPRPKGEPEAIVKIRELIEGKLSEMVDTYVVDEHGNYILGIATARVFIVPTWIESGSTVIRVFAITNLDVPITAELTSYLLEKNLEFVFGGFALDVDAGAVWFNHNLLGDFAHPDHLEATLAAVAQTADRYDEEIKQRFGGRLYIETKDEAIPTPATPGYL